MGPLGYAQASPRRDRGRAPQRPDFRRIPTVQAPAPRYHSPRKVEDTVWTDRLYKADPARYEALWHKHVPPTNIYRIGCHPAPIEAFLTEYLGRTVLLCAVEHHLNSHTEFDVWRFDYACQ